MLEVIDVKDLTLGVPEIAERLGVKRSTALRYFRKQKISAWRLGKAYRTTEKEYNRYVRSLQTGPAAAR